jgi:hypothetical protein
MQTNPLLEKLDWVFTSTDWTSEFPNTLSYPLAKLGSDHTPIHVSIGNNIPKSCIFRFENYWMEFDGFMEIANQHSIRHLTQLQNHPNWNQPKIR